MMQCAQNPEYVDKNSCFSQLSKASHRGQSGSLSKRDYEFLARKAFLGDTRAPKHEGIVPASSFGRPGEPRRFVAFLPFRDVILSFAARCSNRAHFLFSGSRTTIPLDLHRKLYSLRIERLPGT